MDFLNIGPFELILILILAFLFFGPEKLPDMAAKAGKLYRDFRKATFDISKTISEEISNETKIKKEAKNQPALEPGEKTNSGSTESTSPPLKSDGTPYE